MFIFEMISMTIAANIGLIAIVAILAVSVFIAVKGEAILEGLVERHPWLMEDTDKNLFEIIRDRKK